MKYLIHLYLGVLLTSNLLFASSSDANFTFSYYQDGNSTLSISDIALKPFTPMENNSLSKGFTSDSYWIKITFNSKSQIMTHKILYIDNPTLDNVDFYEDETSIASLGDHKRSVNRQSIAYAFPITTHNDKTYYLRLQSKNGLFTQLKIQTELEHNTYIDREKIFLAFFFGFLFSLIVYNIFLFISLKEKVYLYYIAFQISIFMLLLSYSGLGYYLLWENQIYLNEFIYEKFEIFALFFALIFAKNFLNTQQHSVVLNYVININLLLLLYIAITPWQYPILFFQIILIHTVLIGFVMIGFAIIKGIQNATLFFVATFFILLGTLLTFLKIFGVLEVSFITTWSVYIGSMIEAILFSIALAKRIESLKLAQQTAQAKSKSLSTHLNQKNLLLKEVRHRMKNNLQVISSFISIAQMQSTKNQVILNTLHDRLMAITNLHEAFEIQKNDKDIIEMKQYLLELIHNINLAYNKKNATSIKHNIVSFHLAFDQALLVGLILNEVLTNAFKYAFTQTDDSLIQITLEEISHKYKLTISDNGCGFNQTLDPKGLGLTLLQRMIKKQLGGHYTVDSTPNGTIYTIWF